jgi:glycosyltransferase involved in cell wall biosynthesis
MPGKKLISIVVPVFNERDNINPLHDALVPVLAGLEDRYDFDILFTDNHSTDETFSILRRLAAKDRRVRALRFSRNFGFQRSILTGYNYARGDAAIQMDCDLQDPPALIPVFLSKWEEGYQVVYGERRSRKESVWSSLSRKIFYRLIDLLSEDPLPLDAGDFRLVDRCVLNELKFVNDDQPYLRGTIATLGFNQIGIPYDREERQRGESKFTMRQLFSLALDGILNHSIVPLRVATYLGLLVALCTFGAIVFYTVGALFFARTWPPGFATVTVLLLGSLSLNALFLGVIGEYVGRIYRQMKRGALTVIQEEIDPAGEQRLSETQTRAVGAPESLIHKNR